MFNLSIEHFMLIASLKRRIVSRIKRDYRKWSNPYLAPYRLKKLKKHGISTDFSIISNNCWAGFVYQHYGLPYLTPTVGMFFFAQDYIKFIYDIKSYLNAPLEFITLENSRYVDTLKKYGKECVNCPIAKCLDIEIIFMHYHSPEEAEKKWRRRISRINWNNVIYKFSEMNGCTVDDLRAFDSLPVKNKVMFTHKDYGFSSQCIYTEFSKVGSVPNDTDNFNKYIDLPLLLNGDYKFENK